MDKQIILVADEEGNFTGEYIPKEIGHTGEGKRHLAISVLVYNSKGEVLLQRRKHRVFDDIWDISGATHPLRKLHSCHSEERSDVGIYINKQSLPLLRERQDCHAPSTSLRARNDEKCECSDETLEEATRRCLKREYGITEEIGLKNLGFFNYFARYGEYCENEHCCLMVGEYNGDINLNSEVGYGYKWTSEKKFLKDINKNPQKYSPWAVKAAKLIRTKG